MKGGALLVAGVAVSLMLALPGRARGDDAADADQRRFSLSVEYESCSGLSLPAEVSAKLTMSSPHVSPYAEIYLDNDKVDVARRFHSNEPDPEWGDDLKASVSDVAMDGSVLALKLRTIDDPKRLAYEFGWINLTLPTAAQQSGWDEADFGSKNSQSELHTQEVVFGSHAETYGTCSFRVKLFASRCNPGEYINSIDAGPCLACTGGFKCASGFTRERCDAGEFSGAGSTRCEECPAGTTLADSAGASEAAACEACDAGTYRRASDDSCEACDAGAFGLGGSTSSACDGACSAGYVCAAGSATAEASKCSVADPKFFCPAGAAAASLASDGFYTVNSDGDAGDASTRSAQKECPAGSACDDGVKVECAPGSYSDRDGESACAQCAAGRFGLGGSSSEQCDGPCEAGYACAKGSASATAAACSSGDPRYFCAEGSAQSTTVRAGYYSTGGASTSTRSGEAACPVGSQCVNGVRTLCAAGEYQDDEGQEACKACPAGLFGGEGSVTAACGGSCEKGHVCLEGSAQARAQTCSADDPSYYCPAGSTEALRATAGHYTVGETYGTRFAQQPCQEGHMCEGGLMEKCLAEEGEFQDAEGQASCQKCAKCATDQFRSGCGGADAGSCGACAITASTRAALCDDVAVFIPCDGSSTSDVAQCFQCTNFTGGALDGANGTGTDGIGANLNFTGGTVVFNSTEQEDDFFRHCTPQDATLVNVQTGLPAWAVGVATMAIAAVFCVAVLCILRKRKAMRSQLETLDRKNKSFEQDQELAVSLENNVNPMFRKITPDTRRQSRLDALDAVSIIHDQEVGELNKHKHALEEEVRRLKKQQQQDEVDRAVSTPSTAQKARKKEFRGGVTLH